MDFNTEDVQNILKIIDGSSLEELHLELGNFTLIVRRRGADVSSDLGRADGGSAPAPSAAPLPVWPEGGGEPVVVPQGPPRPVREGGVEVKAPMVGTFYRAPAPGAPPFVEVGSLVAEHDRVCMIEVMKLMNSIQAGCRGRVVEICAENGTLVEYGQTLMAIEPLP